MSVYIPSGGVAKEYGVAGQTVASARRFLSLAQAVGAGIGAARIAVGVGFLAAPAASVRVLGVDTATAKRVTPLARMAAARDVILGVGATAGSRRTGVPTAGWVLAGAVADAGDAVFVAGAMRSGKAGGITAAGVVAVAVSSALAGGWAAVELARRR